MTTEFKRNEEWVTGLREADVKFRPSARFYDQNFRRLISTSFSRGLYTEPTGRR